MKPADLYGPLSNVVPRMVVVRYKRPLVLAIAGSVLLESILFLVYGVLLYPGGSLLTKALWTIVFCGLGMGSVLGALLVLFVVDRLSGPKAIVVTTVLTVLALGVGCNLLCFTLDANYFNYFGGRDGPVSFVASGIFMSFVGGLGLGWLVFSSTGQTLFANSREETDRGPGWGQI